MKVEILKGESYDGEHGLVGSATFTPYYLVIDGCKHFLTNLATQSTRKDYKSTADRSRVASLLWAARANKYQFVTWRVSRFKSPLDLIEYVSDNSYSFLVFGELFQKGHHYTDFHGNLVEESQSFCYRIFDAKLLETIENKVLTMKKQYHYKSGLAKAA